MSASAPRRLSISLLRDPVHCVALGFGTGLSPWMPGTLGSALGLIPCWFVAPLIWPVKLALAAVAFLAGIRLCGVSSQRLGVHDHPGIVFDEIAAMLTITVVLPQSWPQLAVAFALFRIFDIWKPWPIRDLDHRLSGGLGIMLDDQMAAVYAAICLGFLQYGIYAS
ncbi:MAG TPA: phosphatidylglycerophosphatase A [Gammaproteobacteria bacterium]|nr:phosphatidylglycerophosphatase A [Gammaproteobacteria bacterium]